MTMNETCSNIHLPLPLIPQTANQTINVTHPTYKLDSNGLAQVISTALFNTTLSKDEIHAFLDNFIHKDINSWTVSDITQANPVLSVIIYTSIALGLFLIFSIIFCVISCRKYYKTQDKRRTSKGTQVCAVLLIIVYLIGIGDMFYVAYRINKSKTSIDDSIQQFNREIYPREISEHLIYLNKQLGQLDQYCTEQNSIFINASKSILIETFDEILNTTYFIKQILQSVKRTDDHVQELNTTIAQHAEFPPEVTNTFKQLQEGFDTLMANIQTPAEEICHYANDSQTEIDEKLVEALNVVHDQLKNLNDTIQKDILQRISPWEEHLLMSNNTEEEIREYVNIGGIVCMVLILILGGLPVFALLCVLISGLCGCHRDSFDEYDLELPMEDFRKQDYRGRGHKVAPARRSRKSIKSTPSCLPVCSMRLGFFLMMIILLILTPVTSIFFALDMGMQASCRTIHDDQPYLINLLANYYNESVDIFDSDTELNTTILNLLDDCRNHVHFSVNLLKNYWSTLEKDMTEMINTLNRQIFDQFIQTIQKVDIPTDMILLKNLTQQANVTDVVTIIDKIESELTTINGYFDQIIASNASLPQDLVRTTINQFEDYLQKVLNSTIDACPLPLSTIYKTDTLACHTLAGSFSGLWLSMFIFMLLTILGLSVCGISVYKRIRPIMAISTTTF